MRTGRVKSVVVCDLLWRLALCAVHSVLHMQFVFHLRATSEMHLLTLDEYLFLFFSTIIVMAQPGLTLYTKKTRSMLNQMERVSKSQAQRKGPPKFGPKTKDEHEKTRVSTCPCIDDCMILYR